MRNKRKNKHKKYGLIVVLIAIILFGIGYGSYVYNIVRNYKNLIMPGVTIDNIDMSGKTREQAYDILKKDYYTSIQNSNIDIKYIDKTYTIKFSDLDAKYDLNDTVNKAFSYGRNLGIIKQYKIIKSNKRKNYKLSFTYNKTPINDAAKLIEKQVNKDPADAVLTQIGGSQFSVSPEIIGKKLNSEKLIKTINDKVSEAKVESFQVDAPIEDLVPKVTKEKLKTVNAFISSFSTSFATSSYERSTNIELATKSINGTLVMPGEVFSFNGVVGQRTAEKGYKAAPVIVGNKVESGYGGGICQVSTTLYNAALLAGLNSVERAHHTLPSSYIPLGRDATVSYGAIDYKFKNTLDYPIYIESSANNKNIVFSIYSSNNLKNTTYSLRNDIFDTVQSDTIYQDDPNLEAGKTEVVQKAYTGYKVKLYRDICQNGKIIKTELISNDYYKPVQGIIKRGMKIIKK